MEAPGSRTGSWRLWMRRPFSRIPSPNGSRHSGRMHACGHDGHIPPCCSARRDTRGRRGRSIAASFWSFSRPIKGRGADAMFGRVPDAAPVRAAQWRACRWALSLPAGTGHGGRRRHHHPLLRGPRADMAGRRIFAVTRCWSRRMWWSRCREFRCAEPAEQQAAAISIGTLPSRRGERDAACAARRAGSNPTFASNATAHHRGCEATAAPGARRARSIPSRWPERTGGECCRGNRARYRLLRRRSW